MSRNSFELIQPLVYTKFYFYLKKINNSKQYKLKLHHKVTKVHCYVLEALKS